MLADRTPSRTTRRPRLVAAAACAGALAALGVAAPGASAASTVHRAYGNGPFKASDCSKAFDYGFGSGIKVRLCIKHSGSTVTAGWTNSSPSVPDGSAGFRWSIVGHAYTPGSPDKTYEKFTTYGANKPGYNVSGWVVRGGVPSNVCAATTMDGKRSPRRNGSGKAC